MQDDVRAFYDKYSEREWSRFETALGLLEFSTGRHLIKKYFPGSGAVCDIGAGPGRYSEFLANLGYDVTLIDLSPELIRIAKEKLSARGVTISRFVCGSATDLSMLPDGKFDAGLMMGPMYHLTQQQDRHAALNELRRIMKPGGIAMITFFGSYGMLRLGIADMVNRYQKVSEIERLLGPTSYTAAELSGFTACHFSTPIEIKDEVQAAGFSLLSYASAQGFAGGMRHDLEKLFESSLPAFYNVVDVAVRYCEVNVSAIMVSISIAL